MPDRILVATDMGRRTIGARTRRFLATLSDEERDLLWELLRGIPKAADDFLAERGQPRSMRRHILCGRVADG